jgi:hypothetical protein
VKVIFLFKRKAGTTHEQFRDYYETRHSLLAVRLLPFFKSYTRNYIRQDGGFKPEGGPALGAAADFDVVTELVFENQAAYDRMLDALKDPSIRDQIIKDEENFMDRSPGGRLMFTCDASATPAAKLKEFA